MGHIDMEVLSSEVTDTSLDLVLRRQVEMEIPSVAKKFLSPSNTVTSNDHWEDRGDGTYGGQFTVEIKGAPAESRGKTSLVPIDDLSGFVCGRPDGRWTTRSQPARGPPPRRPC